MLQKEHGAMRKNLERQITSLVQQKDTLTKDVSELRQVLAELHRSSKQEVMDAKKGKLTILS